MKPNKFSMAEHLPRQWQLKRLKFIAMVQTGMAKGKDHGEAETVDVPYLRVANVQDGYLALDDVATMTVPVADLERYRLQPGDVLMNEGGDFDKLGRGHVWHGQIEPCIHQNHVFAVRPHGVSPEWLNAWTGSAPAQFYFMGRAKQSTNLASISSSNVMELPVPVPPPAEQVARLALIDRASTRIDALIAKKTRFIALLREKRQALITQAVTQGLDPTVPMKDSGVAWLGRVPAHWAVTRIKYVISSMSQGWSPECEARPAEGNEWGVMKVGCVNGGTFDRSQNKALPASLQARADLALKKGDVLVSRANTRELVGGCAVIEQDEPTLMLCDKLYRLVVGADVVPAFLAAVIVVHGRRQVEIEATGASSSMVNISQEVIRDLPVAMPPMGEQSLIMDRVALRSGQLDSLMKRVVASVALLKERRAALITAAVTGQIDVREPT
ncbi:hypothetical protein [Roseateles sp.]|uniref:hypothetical protein n=1 Tax=Roseateles sp. TaxID=1971397 RepID=UPI00286D16F4|nr:hypothetical protein [Roseateles sp.]